MTRHALLEHHHRQLSRRAWRDLQHFCGELEARGQLKRIDQPVAPALEITGLCRHALLNGGPALAGRIEERFQERFAALPPATRLLLLVAAAEPVGDPLLVWKASSRSAAPAA